MTYDDLVHYFTGNTARKKIHDFNNRKIQFGEIKLEEAKNCRMYLNQI